MHEEISNRIQGLLEGETDWVAAMATVVCELHHGFDHFHWTGFYRTTNPVCSKSGRIKAGTVASPSRLRKAYAALRPAPEKRKMSPTSMPARTHRLQFEHQQRSRGARQGQQGRRCGGPRRRFRYASCVFCARRCLPRRGVCQPRPDVSRFGASLKFLAPDSEFGLQGHLVLPSELFDDPPRLFRTFVILDIDDFVSCVCLEGSHGFSVSEDKVGRTKPKSLFHDVRKIRCDGVGRWEDKVSDGRNGFGFLQQLFSTPANLVEVLNEEAFDEGLVLFKSVENGFQFLRLERWTSQLGELTKRDDGEFFDEVANVFFRNSARSTPSGTNTLRKPPRKS